MAESKKYFWLRLKRDFFKRHDVQIIEGVPNGKEIILFYMKLMCESVDHEGKLRFSDEIPYTKEMLARITNTDSGIVDEAIETLMRLHMVEVLDDGTFYLTHVPKMIGQAEQDEHTRESTRNRVKAFRERAKENQNEECNVTETLPKRYSNVTCNGEIEIDKELEIEKEKELKIDYQLIADMYNDTCVSFPHLKSLSDARKKAIKARLKFYTLDDFKNLFEKAEASDFLKGRNDNNWSATFDWMIKDTNMAKILDGNYDNKAKRDNKLEKSYEMISRWAEEG